MKPVSLLAVFLVLGLSADLHAQASGSGAPANLPQPWPPKAQKDGYLSGPPGYVRFPEGPAADTALVGCAERGGAQARTRMAFGPVDEEGWVEYIDLLRCDGDKRVLRIKAPNAWLEPYTDSQSLLRSRRQAEQGFYRETVRGSLITLRSGEVKWLDYKLREIDYDPARTLFGSIDVLHLLDEPGLFLPYLASGEPYRAPAGLRGFRYLEPDAGAFDRPAGFFRQRVEVWETAKGRRYGACGNALADLRYLATPPPPCGPLYRQVEARVLTWDSALVKRATNLVLLGEREDGRWEVAYSQGSPLINPGDDHPLRQNVASLATADERSQLAPGPLPELLTAVATVYAGRMAQQEREVVADRRAREEAREASARMAAAMIAQRRAELLADLERRRQQAEARRKAVAAALAAGEPRCWKTADCGLTPRQRYDMAREQGDDAGAHGIAVAAYGQDRSLVIDDIVRDWAGVAPGRGPRFWQEERVHAIAVRDAFVRQGIGRDIWGHAERWSAQRDSNQRSAAAAQRSGWGNLTPLTLGSASGARPLSSLEQDYYVGRGYVVVRQPRRGF